MLVLALNPIPYRISSERCHSININVQNSASLENGLSCDDSSKMIGHCTAKRVPGISLMESYEIHKHDHRGGCVSRFACHSFALPICQDKRCASRNGVPIMPADSDGLFLLIFAYENVCSLP